MLCVEFWVAAVLVGSVVRGELYQSYCLPEDVRGGAVMAPRVPLPRREVIDGGSYAGKHPEIATSRQTALQLELKQEAQSGSECPSSHI